MAMGEVKGTNEHTIMAMLSTAPLPMLNMTTQKAMTKSMDRGMMEVLISSSLVAVEPMAP